MRRWQTAAIIFLHQHFLHQPFLHQPGLPRFVALALLLG
jgi:hypothetical protein